MPSTSDPSAFISSVGRISHGSHHAQFMECWKLNLGLYAGIAHYQLYPYPQREVIIWKIIIGNCTHMMEFHIISQLNSRISDAVLGSIPQDLKGKNTHLCIPISQTLLEYVFLKLCLFFFPIVINTLKFDFF